MMGAITQIGSLFLKSTDVSQALSKVINDTLLQQPGCLLVRWSLLYEDATKFRCFIDWDNISNHELFLGSPSYQSFLDNLEPLVESSPQFFIVEFHPSPTPVLDNMGGKGKSPVAEVLYLHFPSDESLTAEMKNTATVNAERFLTESAPSAKGCTGETAMGWITGSVEFNGESCRALVVLVGWESLEAHREYRSTDAFAESVSLLRGTPGMKGVSVVHVSLTTVKRND